MGTGASPEYTETVQDRPRTAKTILVVEDEAFVCEVTCDLLEHSGYRVLKAGDAAAARKLFSRYGKQIDLLLCDAVLPDENGMSLACALHRKSASLKLIVASGYPRSELDKTFQQAPKAEFLTKPYSSVSLIAIVEKVLNQDSPAAPRV